MQQTPLSPERIWPVWSVQCLLHVTKLICIQWQTNNRMIFISGVTKTKCTLITPTGCHTCSIVNAALYIWGVLLKCCVYLWVCCLSEKQWISVLGDLNSISQGDKEWQKYMIGPCGPSLNTERFWEPNNTQPRYFLVAISTFSDTTLL